MTLPDNTGSRLRSMLSHPSSRKKRVLTEEQEADLDDIDRQHLEAGANGYTIC